jgi:hypothetical protein
VRQPELLIERGDINTGTDTFATQSSTTNPGGSDGASALFVNQHDTRAIGDTILILPDSAAATTTLEHHRVLHRDDRHRR